VHVIPRLQLAATYGAPPVDFLPFQVRGCSGLNDEAQCCVRDAQRQTADSSPKLSKTRLSATRPPTALLCCRTPQPMNNS